MKIVFLGSGDIGVPALEWLLAAPDITVLTVVTQPDRPSGRGLAMRASRVKQVAEAQGIPVLQPEKIRIADSVAKIASLRPDLLVVMAYGQILPPSLLESAPLGALNLHASLLPRHRGASPVHAALLAGDPTTGITAMWMDAGLDTGDILLKREIDISAEETAGSLHDRLSLLAPVVLEESIRLIREGRAPGLKQDDALATYAPKLDRSTGRIDWSLPASEIARRVRALNPWPGSVAELELADGKILPVKIRRAEALPGSGKAGEVMPGFLVGCGEGFVRILEIQAPGGRAMSGEEFLRGHRAVRFVVADSPRTETPSG